MSVGWTLFRFGNRNIARWHLGYTRLHSVHLLGPLLVWHLVFPLMRQLGWHLARLLGESSPATKYQENNNQQECKAGNSPNDSTHDCTSMRVCGRGRRRWSCVGSRVWVGSWSCIIWSTMENTWDPRHGSLLNRAAKAGLLQLVVLTLLNS